MDVEVEVDSDPLEEPVGHRHEPHFDRHLQVLQPSQLFEQVGDLVVHLLRLADDQAERRVELLDRSGPADILPRVGGDRLRDQVDELREVRLGTPANESSVVAAPNGERSRDFGWSSIAANAAPAVFGPPSDTLI